MQQFAEPLFCTDESEILLFESRSPPDTSYSIVAYKFC